MLLLQQGRSLDGVVLVDVFDDVFDLFAVVAQLAQGGGHGAVDDLQQAAANQLLVLDEREVGLDAGGVAVHHQPNRPGGGEDGRLGVAIAVLAPELDGVVPRLAGGVDDLSRLR